MIWKMGWGTTRGMGRGALQGIPRETPQGTRGGILRSTPRKMLWGTHVSSQCCTHLKVSKNNEGR